MRFDRIVEEIEVRGRDVAYKVREIIRAGNVTRIVVKDKHGDTFAEIPVTIGVVGLVLLPFLTLLSGLLALVVDFRIVVERVQPKATRLNASLVKNPNASLAKKR